MTTDPKLSAEEITELRRTARMGEENLTEAYMMGFHKRDDEVWVLRRQVAQLEEERDRAGQERDALRERVAELEAVAEGQRRMIAKLEAADFWSNWVYPEGATAEQVQSELTDYHEMMQEVSKAYDIVTNGRFSKPNTAHEFIAGAVEEATQEAIAEAVTTAKREAVREFAEELRYRGCTDKDDYLMVHESHIDELLAALDAEPGGGEGER